VPYLFGHFEINGFDIESGDNAFEHNVTDFKRYKKVYSGHFHNPKSVRNIKYIGSVMPFSFHDVDSIRGYYILELDGPEIVREEFIPFSDSPQYKIIYSDQVIAEDMVVGNVVKLVYRTELSNVANDDLVSKLTALNPIMLQPDFTNIVVSDVVVQPEDEDISTLKNAEMLLYSYIDNSTPPDFINPDLVKQFIKQLIRNSKEKD
jgi:hypothetical protein